MREDEESRDAQLVLQTLAGDTNAFSVLYNQHYSITSTRIV